MFACTGGRTGQGSGGALSRTEILRVNVTAADSTPSATTGMPSDEAMPTTARTTARSPEPTVVSPSTNVRSIFSVSTGS